MEEDEELVSAVLDLTPRAREILKRSRRISQERGMSWIGTEHLMLAILEEGHGMAAQSLKAIGATEDVRRCLESVLSQPGYWGKAE